MIGVRTGDVLQLIVNSLLANSAVQALVADRVVGAWSQSADQPFATMARPLIAVSAEGGVPMSAAAVARMSFALYAVSAISVDEAMSVYDTARAVLHAEPLCSTISSLRAVVYEVQTPRAQWMSATTVWTVVGRFHVTAIG